jgi:hypothetical protein
MVLYQEFGRNLKPPFYRKGDMNGSQDPSFGITAGFGV